MTDPARFRPVYRKVTKPDGTREMGVAMDPDRDGMWVDFRSHQVAIEERDKALEQLAAAERERNLNFRDLESLRGMHKVSTGLLRDKLAAAERELDSLKEKVRIIDEAKLAIDAARGGEVEGG